jgi:glycosyltransferase involved in cell wall biosynthesis
MLEIRPSGQTVTFSGPSAPPALSVIVLTWNEEVNLPLCLRSISGLNCEVFVVDSGSTDLSHEIARSSGAALVEHPFENYAAQRNWAQNNLPIRGDWVLHLDADERLTPGLVDEINRLLKVPDPDVSGYLLRKRTIFMGRWIRHGGHYPSYHLRLFLKQKGACEDRLYDQHFMVDGPVRILEADYQDVVASNIQTWTLRHVWWAKLEGQEMTGSSIGRRRVRADVAGDPIQRRRWLREGVYGRAPLLVRPFAYWLYRYVIRFGFLDGKEGLIFHFLQGCWFRFLIDCEILERRLRRAP